MGNFLKIGENDIISHGDRGIDRGKKFPDPRSMKPLDGILTLMTSRECLYSKRVTGRMWPGFGDIVSLVKIVSLDFLERVNLINKRLEQERGEKSTFSHQYSSIGLYCAG